MCALEFFLIFSQTKWHCFFCSNIFWNVQAQSWEQFGVFFISGFSLNVYFCSKCNDKQENDSSNASFYNIEVAPPNGPDDRESVVDIHHVEPGSLYTHCNRLALELYKVLHFWGS